MGNTITRITTFEVTECPNCGMPFGVTDSFMERRRNDGETFYCPSGHSQSFHESELDKVKKRLEASRRNVEAADERATRERKAKEREQRRHSATKGQLTKTKKRVAGGVCPCCNRSFVDLGRHMAGQHPDYAERKGA